MNEGKSYSIGTTFAIIAIAFVMGNVAMKLLSPSYGEVDISNAYAKGFNESQLLCDSKIFACYYDESVINSTLSKCCVIIGNQTMCSTPETFTTAIPRS